MYKKVTSTELKQNTRKIINQVIANPDEPVAVYIYNEPKVVINAWSTVEKKKRASIDELKKQVIRPLGKMDSAKMIRKMRDED